MDEVGMFRELAKNMAPVTGNPAYQEDEIEDTAAQEMGAKRRAAAQEKRRRRCQKRLRNKQREGGKQ